MEKPTTHHISDKKFWQYFFEFFMLFLAVYCGFLSENYREYRVEREREERYMKNMYEDLKSDTAIYSAFNKNTIELLNIVDSLMILMEDSGRNTNIGRIYFLARMATLREPYVFPNDRSFDEMKSSGLLRLIISQQISDSVSTYYHSLKSISRQNDFISERLNAYMIAAGEVFNAEELFTILKDRTAPTSSTEKFISEDPIHINQFLSSAQYMYGSYFLQKKWCMERYERATNLISLIKTEYEFE